MYVPQSIVINRLQREPCIGSVALIDDDELDEAGSGKDRLGAI
jgi:hypothetical protein